MEVLSPAAIVYGVLADLDVYRLTFIRFRKTIAFLQQVSSLLPSTLHSCIRYWQLIRFPSSLFKTEFDNTPAVTIDKTFFYGMYGL